MALRKILTADESALHKVCKPVTKFDAKLHTLLDDMAQTLFEANGVGLAAPQVGILRRAAVIDVRDGKGAIELINPVIIEKTGTQTGNEGCLSAPGEWCEVERPQCVTVKAFDRNGKEFELKGTDLLARAICHEVDHLDGILFIDRVKQDIAKRS